MKSTAEKSDYESILKPLSDEERRGLYEVLKQEFEQKDETESLLSELKNILNSGKDLNDQSDAITKICNQFDSKEKIYIVYKGNELVPLLKSSIRESITKLPKWEKAFEAITLNLIKKGDPEQLQSLVVISDKYKANAQVKQFPEYTAALNRELS